MHRIHIVGLNPRTGTTLLAECMRLCFDIEKYHAHEASLRVMAKCTGVHLTKSPSEISYLETRLRLDPNFHAICLVRDPRDVVSSFHGSKPDQYWPNTSLSRFRAAYAVAKKLSIYPRFLVVRYEDLVADPDGIQSQITQHMPFLKMKARFSAFGPELGPVSPGSKDALNGVRSIDESSIGKWSTHLDRLRDCLLQDGSISEELIDLGYEQDGLWVRKYGLPDVEKKPLIQDGKTRRRLAMRKFKAVLSGLAGAAYTRTGYQKG